MAPLDAATLARVARRLRARADAINGAAFLMPWSRDGYPGIDCSPGAATLGARVGALGPIHPRAAAAVCAPIDPASAAARIADAFAAAPPAHWYAMRGEGATAFLTAAFVAVDVALERVERAVALLEPALDATPPGPAVLFAALQAQPRAAAPVTRLFRNCEMIRERRGASHVAAAGAHGLGPCELCVLTSAVQGDDWLSVVSTWSPAARETAGAALAERGLLDGAGRVTAAGRAVRAAVEAATDEGERPLVAAVGGAADELIDLLGPLARSVLDHAAG